MTSSRAREGSNLWSRPMCPATSTADELVKLAELHKSGVLSDQEFAAAKARLLS